MSIFAKYLLKEISRYIAIILSAVVGIYVAVDFFEKIDNFMESEVPLSKVFIFFIFKIPFIIAQIFPVCVLLSVLVVFGLMTRNNEMLALRSSGISIYQILKPVLIIGVCSSVFLFFFSEVLVPITVTKANTIWLQDVRKRSAVISKEKNIWLKDNHIITHIKYYDRSQKTVFGLTVYYFDKAFKLVKRVDAKKGVFREGKWFLSELMRQHLDEKTGNYQIICHDEQVETLHLLPENLETVVKKSEEMSFNELLEYVKKVEDEGYDATIYRVDLHAKIAFPFICVIMCLVGMGIAAKGKIKEGMAVGIAYGLLTAFLYWICYSFCVSLGYGEMLPPNIAAWTANFIFLCLASFNILNAE